jgi:hypothetical protein
MGFPNSWLPNSHGGVDGRQFKVASFDFEDDLKLLSPILRSFYDHSMLEWGARYETQCKLLVTQETVGSQKFQQLLKNLRTEYADHCREFLSILKD